MCLWPGLRCDLSFTQSGCNPAVVNTKNTYPAVNTYMPSFVTTLCYNLCVSKLRYKVLICNCFSFCFFYRLIASMAALTKVFVQQIPSINMLQLSLSGNNIIDFFKSFFFNYQ